MKFELHFYMFLFQSCNFLCMYNYSTALYCPCWYYINTCTSTFIQVMEVRTKKAGRNVASILCLRARPLQMMVEFESTFYYLYKIEIGSANE